MINVDSLVDQYLPRNWERQPLVSASLVKIFRYIFHESRFQQFERQYPHLEGFDFIEQVLHYFDFSYRVKSRDWENIPTHGRLVIVANHPIGSLDGLALLNLVGEIRRDVKVVANELLSGIHRLDSLLLPVDNLTSKSAKKQLRSIRDHLEQEGALIIFPAGEVSRFGPKGIRDGRWNSGFMRFATMTKSPILPIFVDGRNSFFFYALSLLAKPISTLWLVREMFKQASNHIDIHIGRTIGYEDYIALESSPMVAAKIIKRGVYRLKKRRNSVKLFADKSEVIAHPENRQFLLQEIRQCELLGKTRDGKRIVLYRYRCDSSIMREIGRLRELTFRAVKEGTGRRRDTDIFDTRYDHIILWDDNDLELVGAYRLIRCAELMRDSTQIPENAIYSQTLFNYDPGFLPYFSNGMELGRSFVQPRYWGKRSIDYLWQGIGAYLRRYPEVRYLFGPVSLSHDYPDHAKSLLISFYRHYFGAKSALATPLNPYDDGGISSKSSEKLSTGQNYNEDFKVLKNTLAESGLSVPTLFKQYTELCHLGGSQFLAFNVDKDFSDCVDGLILVDLKRVRPEKYKRYMGSD